MTGPRQSGKTTIVRQALRRVRGNELHGHRIAIDDPEAMTGMSVHPAQPAAAPDPRVRNVDWLVRVWKWAREQAWERRRGFVLALDEIQDIPQWSGAVKGLWDRDRDTGCPLRVIVLGSAPWAMLTGRGESLAGRFTPFDVRHWSLSEMVDAFDFTLDEYVYFGGYPGAAPLVRDLGAWRQYVAYSIIAPVFGRDILALTRVDRSALMRQIVDLVPEYSGQIVRYDHLGKRLRGTGHAATVAHYLDLLSDAGIVTPLPKYSGSAVKRTGSNPKLNVLNTGLMTALSGYSLEQARADRTFWGRLLESAVGAHLHNTLDVSMRLSYWRDDPFEVDFVLSQGPRVLGIEVKSSARARSLPGLAEFRKRFPRARTLLVGGRGGVPPNEFLSRDALWWLDEACGNAGVSRAPRQKPAAGDTGMQVREKRIEYRRRGRENHGFITHIREHDIELRMGRCPAGLLHEIGEAYHGFVPGRRAATPRQRALRFLEGHEDLADAVIEGLRRTVDREDLPTLREVIRLNEQQEISLYALPILAGFDSMSSQARDSRSVAEIARATALYLLTPLNVEGHPEWYRWALRHRPQGVAEALLKVTRSRVRRRSDCPYLWDLARNDSCRGVVRLVALPLLRAFPTRCTEPQISALREVLLAALRWRGAELEAYVEQRVSRPGQDVSQRALWLTAALMLSPARYVPQLAAFLADGEEARSREVVRLLAPREMDPLPMIWPTRELGAMIEMVGSRYSPWRPEGFATASCVDEDNWRAESLISTWATTLVTRTGRESSEVLGSLGSDPALASWHFILETKREEQLMARRHGACQVTDSQAAQPTLANEETGDPASLAALVVDKLESLATEIRHGNTDDWRQYWREDEQRRLLGPRREESCRDALLSDLRKLLPGGVDAHREAVFTGGNKSDIRVSFNGHAIPVEIRKDYNSKLWRAVANQLVPKYATAPESSGFGIFLVLWFGQGKTPLPPTGRRPKTPEELSARLEEHLAGPYRHKISVIVIDVSATGV